MQVLDSRVELDGDDFVTRLVLPNKCIVRLPMSMCSLPRSIKVPMIYDSPMASSLIRLDSDEFSIELVCFAPKRIPGLCLWRGSQMYYCAITSQVLQQLSARQRRVLTDALLAKPVENGTVTSTLGYVRAEDSTSEYAAHEAVSFTSRTAFGILCLSRSKAHLEPNPPLVLATPTLQTFYKGPKLGEGTFGKVYKYASAPGGLVRVCKELKMSDSFEESWKNVLAETTLNPEVLLVTASKIRLLTPLDYDQDLQAVLDDLDPMAQLAVLRGVLNDLHQLHRRGMAHSDLKTTNIVASEDGRASIIDLGACSMYEGLAYSRKCTLDTRAPEIFRDGSTWLPGDVWAVGTIFLDMLNRKRGSLIEWTRQGKWSDGRSWDWKVEEAKIGLLQIAERVDAHDIGILPFLNKLGAPIQTMGEAFFLSQCMHFHPKDRSSLGLTSAQRPAGMFRWPFPIAACSPPVPKVRETESRFCAVQEDNYGLVTLDSRHYLSSLDVPEPMGRLRDCRTNRKPQLIYIALMLEALGRLTFKHLVVTLDLLDRVSSSATLAAHAQSSPLSHRLLENACIVLCSMLCDSFNVSLRKVLKASLALVSVPKSSAAERRLQQCVARTLCTLQFRCMRPDNVWELLQPRMHSLQPLRIVEAYASWPDGNRSVHDFISDAVQSPTSQWFNHFKLQESGNLPVEWNSQCFEHQVLEPLGLVPPRSIPSMATSAVLEAHLQLYHGVHPFLIPLDGQSLHGLSRQEFEATLEAHVQRTVRGFVTPRRLTLEQCSVCEKDAVAACSECAAWGLCGECKNALGSCAQCLRTDEGIATWFTRSGRGEVLV